MVYSPLINRNHIRMRDIVEKMQDIPTRKKGLRWQKKDWKFVQGRKKFRIYSMRIGSSSKYKLAFNETSYLWNEVSAPARSSWEVCDDGKNLLFVLLIDGVRRTNIIKQLKDVKP